MSSIGIALLKPATGILITLALTFLRISIGLMMVRYGKPNIMGGIETWRWLGSTMSNFGIHRFPVIWGLLAAAAEFFGGMLLALGLATRVTSFFLAIVMVVAYQFHISRGDSFQVYAPALAFLMVFLSFVIMGGGPWSIDQLITAA